MSSIYAVIGHGRADMTWWQECIRAPIIFFYGLVLIRFAGRRAFGRQSPLDIVLAVVIGSNLSRTLTANAPFFPTLASTAALVGIYWVTSHVVQFSACLEWLVKGRPALLMRDGRLDRRVARKQGVTESDLNEAVRTHGVGRLSDVDTAVLERNGNINVIRRQSAARGSARR